MIIFLDIDGVLNHSSWHFPQTYIGGSDPQWVRKAMQDIDDKTVENLNHIILRTAASIVISSSWRKNYPLPTIERMLMRRGLTSRCVIGATPNLNHGPNRGGGKRIQEIEHWLYFADLQSLPYVILDDDKKYMGTEIPEFLHVPDSHGLTKELADEAIEILCRPRK